MVVYGLLIRASLSALFDFAKQMTKWVVDAATQQQQYIMRVSLIYS